MVDKDEEKILLNADLDSIIDKLSFFEIKAECCLKCGKVHLPSYGADFGECDECFFARFPKEMVKEFNKRIIEEFF